MRIHLHRISTVTLASVRRIANQPTSFGTVPLASVQVDKSRGAGIPRSIRKYRGRSRDPIPIPPGTIHACPCQFGLRIDHSAPRSRSKPCRTATVLATDHSAGKTLPALLLGGSCLFVSPSHQVLSGCLDSPTFVSTRFRRRRVSSASQGITSTARCITFANRLHVSSCATQERSPPQILAAEGIAGLHLMAQRVTVTIARRVLSSG